MLVFFLLILFTISISRVNGNFAKSAVFAASCLFVFWCLKKPVRVAFACVLILCHVEHQQHILPFHQLVDN